MYIQDKVEEYADEVFDLLDNGAHIYFCGLKGMMPGAAPRPCTSPMWQRLCVESAANLLKAWLSCALCLARTFQGRE